jgi:hypothetical protein
MNVAVVPLAPKITTPQANFTSEHTPKWSVSFQQGSCGAVNHSEVSPIVPLADDSFIPDTIPDDELLVVTTNYYL